jgi:transposase
MNPKQKRKRLHLTRAVSVRRMEAEIKTTTDEKYKTRLRAVLLFKQGRSQKEITETMIVSRRSVHGWIVTYNEEGRDGLRTRTTGRPLGRVTWSEASFERLAREIDTSERYWSVHLMAEWLAEHEKTIIPESTIWYRITKIGYSHKSSRPYPYKGDAEQQTVFKKRASPKH